MKDITVNQKKDIIKIDERELKKNVGAIHIRV